MSLHIFYTGDLITPDGSDSFDGKACEEGYGATVESGWVDPEWSLGEVRQEREDVRPDTWEPADGPMIDWIVERIGTRLGWVDAPEYSERGTYYATEATGPYDSCYTGIELRLAAHVDGASPEVLHAVSLALSAAQTRVRTGR